MADPEKADAVAFLVILPEPADNPAEGLLRRIDERARNRSAFPARAAGKALAEG